MCLCLLLLFFFFFPSYCAGCVIVIAFVVQLQCIQCFVARSQWRHLIGWTGHLVTNMSSAQLHIHNAIYRGQKTPLTTGFFWAHLMEIWLVVEPTHLRNIRQKGFIFPILGLKIKNVWNHHLEKIFLVILWDIVFRVWGPPRRALSFTFNTKWAVLKSHQWHSSILSILVGW